MTPTYIYDGPALVAFFHDHTALMNLWRQAEHGEVQIFWPAAAVAAANFELGGSWNSWHPLLLNGGVECLPLSEATAIDAGRLHHDVATAHVAHEALAARGLVVTTDPGRYAGLNVPVLPV